MAQHLTHRPHKPLALPQPSGSKIHQMVYDYEQMAQKRFSPMEKALREKTNTE